MQFGTRIDTTGEYAVVIVEGDFDLAAAPGIRTLLRRTIDEGWTSMVIDLSECTMIDSAGLGMLLGALRRARAAKGSVAVVVPDEHVRRVFLACDLDRVFALHPTVGDATQALASPAERIR